MVVTAAYVPPRCGDRDGRLEWTGQAWTLVCPDCDLPMTEYNGRAELCCPACGLAAVDVPR